MERTDQDFKDGLALDLFSPRNRTLVVQKNASHCQETLSVIVQANPSSLCQIIPGASRSMTVQRI